MENVKMLIFWMTYSIHIQKYDRNMMKATKKEEKKHIQNAKEDNGKLN